MTPNPTEEDIKILKNKLTDNANALEDSGTEAILDPLDENEMTYLLGLMILKEEMFKLREKCTKTIQE